MSETFLFLSDRQRFTIGTVEGFTQDGEGGTVTEVRMPEAVEYVWGIIILK